MAAHIDAKNIQDAVREKYAEVSSSTEGTFNYPTSDVALSGLCQRYLIYYHEKTYLAHYNFRSGTCFSNWDKVSPRRFLFGFFGASV